MEDFGRAPVKIDVAGPPVPTPPDAGSIDRVFRAIASAARRTILDALSDGRARTAAEVAACSPDLTRSATSQHLRTLREAGLVEASRVGRSVTYTIRTEQLDAIYESWLASHVRPDDPARGPDRSRAEPRGSGAPIPAGSAPNRTAEDIVRRVSQRFGELSRPARPPMSGSPRTATRAAGVPAAARTRLLDD